MQSDKCGRDHVVRQAVQQMALEFARGGNTRLLLRKNVSHQLFLSRLRDVGDRRSKINALMVSENATDLIQFDPLSANLGLPVNAAAKFDFPIRPSNSAIARAIHASTWRSCDWCARKTVRQEASLSRL